MIEAQIKLLVLIKKKCVYVIERVYTIKKEDVVKTGIHEYALCEVGFELQELWIFLNLQPKSHSQIQIDIKKLVAEEISSQ